MNLQIIFFLVKKIQVDYCSLFFYLRQVFHFQEALYV